MLRAFAIAENLPWQPRGFVIIEPQEKKKKYDTEKGKIY